MALHKAKTKLTADAPVSAPAPAKVKIKKARGCKGWLLRIILFFVLAVVAAFVVLYVIQPKYYRILVIGSDQRGTEHARSDSLLLVAIPKSGNKPTSLIMIPRDTFIDDKERGIQKITHYYAMWGDDTEMLGNKELTTKTVEDLLDVKINGTVEVTFDSFTDVVDLVGGVETEEGLLQGKEAVEIVHNRMNKVNGDFGRAAEQREMLMKVIPKLKNPANAKAVYDYVKTSDRTRVDISTLGAASFGVAYMIGHHFDIDLSNTEQIELPGEGDKVYTPDFGKELYYWKLDMEGTKKIIDEHAR